MTYEIPMKDGKVDWETMRQDVFGFYLGDETAITQIDTLKALYNHALEGAATKADWCNTNGVPEQIGEDIRALKEPVDG